MFHVGLLLGVFQSKMFPDHSSVLVFHVEDIVSLSTVDGRPFQTLDLLRIWNNLPNNVTSAPSLPTFRQRLKSFCSRSLFLTVFWTTSSSFLTLAGSGSDVHYLDHFGFL